jgi:hypothetical protein
MEKFMMRNSAGKKDAMFTVSMVSFAIVSVVVVSSMFDALTIFGTTIDFSEPNVPLLTLYLGTCFSSYVFRRTTKDKLEKKVEDDVQYATTDELEERATYQEEHLEAYQSEMAEVIRELHERTSNLDELTAQEIEKINKKIDANFIKLRESLQKSQDSLEKKLVKLNDRINRNKESLEEVNPSTPKVY